METNERAPFDALEKKVPRRGIQTWYRSAYDTHISLSSIADTKANIMISINAISTSVVISFLSYNQMTMQQPRLILPVIVFLVTSLASLVFAVLSIRPRITNLYQPNSTTPTPAANENLFFFGNFTNYSQEAFSQQMDLILRDQKLLYGHMTRDIYQLGMVLLRKYRYLGLAYDIFLTGFIITVVSFILLILF